MKIIKIIVPNGGGNGGHGGGGGYGGGGGFGGGGGGGGWKSGKLNTIRSTKFIL